MPQETPEHILKAYGTSTIVATCPAGQAFEKAKVGYCYDDILKEIEKGKEDKGHSTDDADYFAALWAEKN
jgi:hypothetical protein